MKNKFLSFVLIQIIILLLAVGCSGSRPQVTTIIIPATATDVIPTAAAQDGETATSLSTATNAPEPTATPAPPEILAAGVEIKGVPDIVQVSELGASWVRRNALMWYNIEPEPGARNWNEAAGLDEELKKIAEADMQVVLIVRGTPDWAQQIPGLRCGIPKQDTLDEFAAFLKDAVLRYKEPPYNVKYWELGNEPDIDPSLTSMISVFGCMGDIGDPNYYGGGNYAELLKAAYPAIKAADAEAQVIVGGLLMDCDPVQPPETSPGSGQPLYCTPSRYLEGILVNGGGDYFDGVSFHAYDYYYGAEGQYGNGNWHSAWNTTGPVTAAKVSYIRSLLASFGYTDKFLLNTENALICGRDGSEAECHTEVHHKTKDYYIVQSSTMALAEGLMANIWYDLQGWRGSELIDESRQPLPAYQAYMFNIKMLSGMAYWGRVSGQSGMSGYEFRQGERVVWVVWSLDGEPHEFAIPGNVVTIYDLYGNVVETGSALSVTIAPMYVEWMTGQ